MKGKRGVKEMRERRGKKLKGEYEAREGKTIKELPRHIEKGT